MIPLVISATTSSRAVAGVALHRLLPVLALVLHAYHVCATVRATTRREDYPWARLKWTFLIATLAFCAPALAQLAMHPRLLLNPVSILVLGLYLLPGGLQVILLWWPRVREDGPSGRRPVSAGLSDLDSTHEAQDAGPLP